MMRGNGSGAAGVAERDGLRHGGVPEFQRARLIAATIAACDERGAAKLTPARTKLTAAEIIARAGVSRRTFYELFENTDACVAAALDEAAAGASARVSESYDPAARWRVRLRAGLVALLAYLDEQPRHARLLLVEYAVAGPRALECRERLLAPAIAAVDEGRGDAAAGRRQPSPLTAEMLAGGVVAILRARVAQRTPGPLLALANELMSMVVLPYAGEAAARAELTADVLEPQPRRAPAGDPLCGVEMRLTYRTVRVLMAIASKPGLSNREAGRLAGIDDQGQTSKLMQRLHRLGLVENSVAGPSKGTPNAWRLTPRGRELHDGLAERSTQGPLNDALAERSTQGGAE